MVTAPRPEVRGIPVSSDMGSSFEAIQSNSQNVTRGVYVPIVIGSAIVATPHSVRQVWDVRRSFTSRRMPPLRNRNFHDSMSLKLDQPASSTLFAMLV